MTAGPESEVAIDPPVGSKDETSLGRKVRRGSIWLGGNTLVMRLANILVMAVVARIVAPEEFGVFSIAIVANTAIVTLAELGVASAIARRDLDAEAIAPTAVTVSVGISALFGGLLAVFAEQVSYALGSVEAAPAMRVLAISVALGGLFVVPSAQLQRDFRQSALFRTNLVGTVVGAAVLVGLAMLGDGSLAFAWSRVVGQAITGALVIASVGKRYVPTWNGTAARLLLRFGVPLALANLLSQVVANVDYVFVGHALRLRDVGLYTLAFNVSSWASSVLGSVLSGVVLPAFSAVRNENGDLRGALLMASRAVALVSLPIAALTSGLATPLITTIYGSEWNDAAPVVVVLSVYGAISAIGLLVANILIASGSSVTLFAVQAAVLVVLVPALWLGISLTGILGAGLAHVVTALLVTLPVYLWSLRRSLRIGLTPILSGVAWPLVAAVLAGAIAFGVSQLFGPALLQLLVGGAAGGALYVLLAFKQLIALLPAEHRYSIERRLPRLRLRQRAGSDAFGGH